MALMLAVLGAPLPAPSPDDGAGFAPWPPPWSPEAWAAGPPPGGRGPAPWIEVLRRFDRDGNGRLDATERAAARAAVVSERAERRRNRPGPARRFGPPGPDRRPGRPGLAPAGPGPRVDPAESPSYPDRDLFDPTVVRTLFLELDSADWEQELADFHHTDVDLPARLRVDGRSYPDVGVRFRGQSSFMMVPAGHKRSLNLSLDLVDPRQNLGGARTLNLLNSNDDPTFLRTVLYYQVARRFIPAPRANFVRLVINGESWGIYVNAQQFNKDLTRELFGSTAGDRWKVPGSPGADAGLNYLGDDLQEYRRRYEIKSKDRPAAWAALVKLTRVLEQTPASDLERELRPILDIDGALKFLALENALINNDGYWARASDYSLYRDEKGRFHLIPHDANETFRAIEGPGFRRNSSAIGTGVELSPLAGADNPRRPLLTKLLAVPALRARYLGYLHALARDVLDWRKLYPIIQKHEALIAAEVARDTRKLFTTVAFGAGITAEAPLAPAPVPGPPGPPHGSSLSLKAFVEGRRAYLLAHPLVKSARPQALAALTRRPSTGQ
jgi:hypothetical protein